jgi:colanic acid/amylovoran biosynthesis glycosyltransferase
MSLITPTNTPVRRIAYVMSRFPKLTETFILYEMVELERLGMAVEVFPLVRVHESVVHPEAPAFVARAHFSRPTDRRVLAAQLYWLARRPLAYLRCWRDALWGNRRSRKFLIRACAVVPQAAWVARRVQELGIEHVHAHYATHPALAAYVVHMLTGTPYSITAHAHDLYVERPMLAEKVRVASFVVAISEYNRRLIAAVCGPEAEAKTVVIHCGADLTLFSPPAERARGERFTIICVASLEEYKGQRYLIDACARLARAGVPFRCLLAGEGADRPALEAQIRRLGLQDRVALLGRQPRDRIAALLGEADVVAMPSITARSGKKEGIPVALMEALALELPVVATAISGIPELVEDGVTGLLVPEKDAPALAAALLRIYHDPALAARLGRAGRQKVLAAFDLSANARALAGLLARDWRPRPSPGAAVLVGTPTERVR